MRITDLIIENFGPHLGWRPEGPIADGLTVFIGANEKGKSAVRAFIRMVLFGKMRSNAAGARRFNYIHAAPGPGAGSVSVRVAESKYILRRVEGSAPTVTGDGTGRQDFLNGLIGGIDSKLYENVFSISLTELESIESLNSDEVRDRIYSAGLGLGSVSLPAAMKVLDDERAQPGGLYSPRGGRLRENLNALSEERRALRAAIASNAEYEGLGEQIAEVERAATRLEASLRAAREKELHLRSVNALRNPVARKLDLERQLEAVPEVVSFPAKGLERLTELQEKLVISRERLADVDGRLAITRSELDKLQLVEAFDVHDGEIRRLRSQVQSYEDAARDLPEVEVQAKDERSFIDAGLASLGPDWNDDVLTSFVNGNEVAADLEALGGKLDVAGRAVEVSERELSTSREDLRNAQQTRDTHERAVQRLANDDAEPIEKLRDRERRIERLRLALADRHTVVPAQTAESSRGGIDYVAPVVVALVGIAVAIIFLITDNLPGAIAVFGVSVISALALLRSLGGTSAVANSSVESPSELEQEINEVASELGLANPVAERAVLELQSAVRDALESAGNRDSSVVAFEEAVATCDRIEARVREAGDALSRAVEVADEARVAWEELLAAHSFPTDADATAAAAAVERAGALKNRLENLNQLCHRVTMMRQTVSDVEQNLAPILREADMAPFAPLAAGPALAELTEKFEADAENATAANTFRRELGVAEAERKSQAGRLKEWEAAESELFAAAGVAGHEEFRLLAATIEERKVLERDLQQLLDSNTAMIEPGADAILLEVAETTGEQVEAERQAANDEIDRIGADLREVTTGIGGLRNERENLEKANPAIELQQKIGRLEQQVEDDARRWAVLTIAEKAITQTRDRYQSERQAPLMLTASQHFKTFTNDAYTNVEAVLGEDVIRVIEANGGIKSIDALSRGTTEQLYLAMRFALIEEYGQHRERMPVLMDDVMVNFDPERTRLACDAIVEFSQRHQVLLLTCHPQTVDMLKDAATQRGCSAPSVIEL